MEMEEYQTRIALLTEIAEEASSVTEVSTLLERILKVTQHSLGTTVTTLFLNDEKKSGLHSPFSVRNFEGAPHRRPTNVEMKVAKWVASNVEPVLINDIVADERFNSGPTDASVNAIIAAPVIRGKKVIGVISSIEKEDGNDFDERDFEVLKGFASTEALILLVSMQITAIDNFSQLALNQTLLDGYRTTTEAMASTADIKDSFGYAHSRRCKEYALLAANCLGLPPKEVKAIEFGALLHDIGKIGIGAEILCKPGPLNDEEWKIMYEHPRKGADILGEIPYLKDARDIVLYHHERYDGNGYPEKLSGEEIPLGARIVAVANAFDAMTTDRSYRAALSADEAIAELIHNMGTQFCPRATEAFIAAFKKREDQLPFERNHEDLKEKVDKKAAELTAQVDINNPNITIEEERELRAQKARAEQEARDQQAQAEKEAKKQQEQAEKEAKKEQAKAEKEAKEREKAEREAEEQREKAEREEQAKAEKEAKEREKAEREAEEQREKAEREEQAKAEKEAKEREKAEREAEEQREKAEREEQAKAEKEAKEREKAEQEAKEQQEKAEREAEEQRRKAEEEAAREEQARAEKEAKEQQAKAEKEAKERDKTEQEAEEQRRKAEEEAAREEQAKAEKEAKEQQAKTEKEAEEREKAEREAREQQAKAEREAEEQRRKAEEEAAREEQVRAEKEAKERDKTEQEAEEQRRKAEEEAAREEQVRAEKEAKEQQAKAEKEAEEREKTELEDADEKFRQWQARVEKEAIKEAQVKAEEETKEREKAEREAREQQAKAEEEAVREEQARAEKEAKEREKAEREAREWQAEAEKVAKKHKKQVAAQKGANGNLDKEMSQGDIRLVVPITADMAEVRKFRKDLEKLEGLRIVLFGSSEEDGHMFVLSLPEPMLLMRAVSEIALVESVGKKGKDILVTLKDGDNEYPEEEEEN
jgi:HD-GYP domain-containing protein (c-di-GMP phosphodiesterase class II)